MQTPYEKYADFCRRVAGIEPKPEHEWEEYRNRSFVSLPQGAGSGRAGLALNGMAQGARKRARQNKNTLEKHARKTPAVGTKAIDKALGDLL